MVQPLDYTLNVLSPMQRFTEGLKFGEDLLTARLARDETQQLMDMRAAQEARAVVAEQERRAAAEAQRARAEKMQADLGGLVALAEGGNLTTDAINQFRLKYSETLDDATNVFTSMEEERQKPLKDFGVKSVTLALTGNAAAAEALYQERIDAAKNAGTPEAMQEARALEADLATLKANPINFATAQATLLRHANYINDEQLKGLLDLAKQGQGAETTEAVRTLQQRAELAGLVPGTPEYNQFMISGGKPPEGMVFRSLPGGGFELVQGSGAGAGQGAKPTEGQLAATAYLQRMVGSEADLSELEAEGDVALPFGANLVVDTTFEGLLSLSEGQQRLLQAQRDWVRAKLRKESGAEIPPAEMMAEMRTYFPQPGDGQKTIAQKRAARARAMTQMEIMSGAEPGAEEVPPTSELPEAFINNPTVQRLVRENANVGVTAESIWNAMTAEERAAYGG